jgi:hypothetical protein
MTDEERKEPADPDSTRDHPRDKRPDAIQPWEWIFALAGSLVPLFGMVFALFVVMATYGKPGARALGTCCLLISSYSLVLLLAPTDCFNFNFRDKSKQAEVKCNAHTVKIVLDRYALDHEGLYPEGIENLIETGCLSEMPKNPFTTEPTRAIAFGSEPRVGELTYLPVTKDGQIKDYYLIGYGTEDDTGVDVNGDGVRDHVIIILSSSDPNESSYVEAGSPSTVLPDLADLLKAKKDNPQAESVVSTENLK